MSSDESLRRVVQDTLRNNPSAEKVTEQQVKDYHDREVINAEMERIRRQNDRR